MTAQSIVVGRAWSRIPEGFRMTEAVRARADRAALFSARSIIVNWQDPSEREAGLHYTASGADVKARLGTACALIAEHPEQSRDSLTPEDLAEALLRRAAGLPRRQHLLL
jgi:hypothetical protein